MAEQVSERTSAAERSENCGASKLESGASKLANGEASGPVLTSQFMAALNHSAEAQKNTDSTSMPDQRFFFQMRSCISIEGCVGPLVRCSDHHI